MDGLAPRRGCFLWIPASWCPGNQHPLRREQRVGFQNSATVVDLGFLRGPLILVEEAAEDGPALDLGQGEASDRVIGYGRVEVAAAMRSPAIVVGLVLGEDLP
jgi:hypothetical protein